MDHATADIKIRPVETGDAAALAELLATTAAESDWLAWGADECPSTPDRAAAWIGQIQESGNHAMLVAAGEGRLVAVGNFERGGVRRTRHVAAVGLAVLKGYQGRGIGRAMMLALEATARDLGVTRLELSVRAGHDIAIGLYRRLGFQEEGVKRHAVRLDDGYRDEILMAKLL